MEESTNIIKILLRESLKEVSIKNKDQFGQGAYHTVYRSNKYPNRLFKIGHEESVDEWLPTFEAYPKYFPKIYNVFNSKKYPEIKIVEIEMLHTNKAYSELKLLDSFLISISDEVDCNGRFVSISDFFEVPCVNKIANAAQAMDEPEILPILFKWAKFLSVVNPIVEKDLGRPLDLHFGNVAYDNNGNLKMIDI